MVMTLSKSKYLLDDSDFHQYRDLFLYSFNLPEDNPYRAILKRVFTNSRVYGIKTADELQASVTSIPFEVNFFDKNIPMAGIANVMSAPEYVQNNSIDKLMKQAFTDMHQKNIPISYLGPFSYDYYRRFGYEQVFEGLQITMPFTNLIRYKQSFMGHLKRFKYSEAQDLIGELFAEHNDSATIIRDNWWWENLAIMFPKDRLAVYYNEFNEVNGYVRYALEAENFVVRDMYYQSPDAFIGLIHFINKHRSVYKNIIINSTDINLKVNNFTTDPSQAQVMIKPSMMARIVDFKRFLQQYPLQVDNMETIELEVNDFLSWNNHIWKLVVKDGQIGIDKSDIEIPEVIVDVQTLTKAMFGYQSLKESFLVGNVQGNQDKIEALDKLFIHQKSQLKDSF